MMRKYKYAIVITSIRGPECISKWCNTDGEYLLIVVGDKKTDDKAWEPNSTKHLVYLSVDYQERRWPALCQLLPKNNYARKNLGYLYAMENAITKIFETDDDNYPLKNCRETLTNDIAYFEGDLGWDTHNNINRPAKWVNTYAMFGQRNIWPRGFPHRYLDDSYPGNEWKTRAIYRPGVIQYMHDIEPDLDAIGRICLSRLDVDEPIMFEKNKMFILPEQVWAPFNSQLTLWDASDPAVREAMYIPSMCDFRFTDILRGYIALQLLWNARRTVAFKSSIGYQNRNEHDLCEDLRSEYTMMRTAHRAPELFGCGDDSLEDYLVSAKDLGMIPSAKIGQEILIAREWIKEISKC